MSENLFRSAGRHLMLRHTTDEEMLGLLTDSLDAARKARIEAHGAVCTVCQRTEAFLRLEQAMPTPVADAATWQTVAVGLRGLVTPIKVVLNRVGAVQRWHGPMPRTESVAGATLGSGEVQRNEWELEDKEAEVTVHVAVERSSQSGGALDIRIRTASEGAGRNARARLEVFDGNGELYASGPLTQFSRIPARVPPGRWLFKVSVGSPEQSVAWEIPIEAVDDPGDP
jgi:hypothetical protein